MAFIIKHDNEHQEIIKSHKLFLVINSMYCKLFYIYLEVRVPDVVATSVLDPGVPTDVMKVPLTLLLTKLEL